MDTPWERWSKPRALEKPESVPVALIVDSPWLPGYAGLDTLYFFFFQRSGSTSTVGC